MSIAPLSSMISLYPLNIKGLSGERVYTGLAKSFAAFSSLSSNYINSSSLKKSISSVYKPTTPNGLTSLLLVTMKQGSYIDYTIFSLT